jgi:hypothetical protein
MRKSLIFSLVLALIGSLEGCQHAFGLSTSDPVIQLGKCQQQVDSVTKTEERYVRLEAEKAALTQQEVLARLIFSEALSTGYWKKRCEAPSSEKLMEGIGWGILNRIQDERSHLNPYFEVIFKKNQFRTSFSSKKKNPFALAFLCPLRAQNYLDSISPELSAHTLYHQAQQVAGRLIRDFKHQGIPPKFQKITHFFYPQSEFFGELRPSWAKKKGTSSNLSYRNLFNSENPCVEFYR